MCVFRYRESSMIHGVYNGLIVIAIFYLIMWLLIVGWKLS